MMIKRREPHGMFADIPCAIVAVGTAIGSMPLPPEDLTEDGYLSLRGMNKYARRNLNVAREVQYKRGERPTLREFLETNRQKAIICVLGHFIYADRNTYWSFLKNAKDPVVAVWYLQ